MLITSNRKTEVVLLFALSLPLPFIFFFPSHRENHTGFSLCRVSQRISGLSVSPLDDHLLTVAMSSSLGEHSCGRMLLLRWDERSQQLLGVAAAEDEENRGYQTGR